MSEIIFFKDILSTKTAPKKKVKKTGQRLKPEPPKCKKNLKASLIEKESPGQR
jgi:hypothetical protein